MAAIHTARHAMSAPVPVHGYAAAFIAAAGLTDATQQAALHQLEADLLDAGLLDPYDPAASVLLAYYPLVGGTAVAHRLNFVNPSVFALGFVGSPSHSATGIAFNGSTQYATTGIYPAQHQTPDSHAMGLYVRSSNGNFLKGARLGGNFYTMLVSSGYTQFAINAGIGGAATPGFGFRAVSRVVGDVTYLAYTNSVNAYTNTQGGANLNLELLLGAMNNEGGGVIAAVAELAGAFFAKTGLDAPQLQACAAACQASQTILNRAV